MKSPVKESVDWKRLQVDELKKRVQTPYTRRQQIQVATKPMLKTDYSKFQFKDFNPEVDMMEEDRLTQIHEARLKFSSNLNS